MKMEIVTCHFDENLNWLQDSPYPVHVVGKQGGKTESLDKTKFPSIDIVPNFGNEAGSYLWYIVNNYHNLPDKITFIHGHEKANHQKIPIFEAIKLYENFSFVDINRHTNYYIWMVPNSDYEKLWSHLLGPFFGNVPKVLNFRGHAQFIVSKDLILSRNIEFWNYLYQETMKLCADNIFLSKKIAIFYENVWHVIFGQDSPMFNDYFDMFVDSEFRTYNLWQFLKAITNDQTSNSYENRLSD